MPCERGTELSKEKEKDGSFLCVAIPTCFLDT